jgi:2-aminoadipate transaminase
LVTEITSISFNRGVPSVDSFPTEQIRECAAAVLQKDADTVLQYGKPFGYLPLREMIAGWHGVSAEEVMVSNGSLQILDFLSTLLLHPGDTVFVEQPTYDRTVAILRRHEADVVGIPLQSDGPDVEHLAEQLRTVSPKLLYLIPDFQNPSGITTSLAKREDIVRLAEEYNFWIVEDAPYRPLRYKGMDVPTVKSLSPNRVMHMSSFTKLLSPGLRVGYLVAPQRILDTLEPIVANTYVCPGLVAQGIAHEFCKRGLLQPNIEKLKVLYGPKLEATLQALDDHMPKANWVEPEGGFFVGVTLPEGVATADLRKKAQTVGVSLSDGRGFFPQGGGHGFLRLAFPALAVSDIRDGVSRIGRLVQKQ